MSLVILAIISLCVTVILAPLLLPTWLRWLAWYQDRWYALLPPSVRETRAQRIARLERELDLR